ncbi:MAG: hypothetical protein ACE15B_03875 [Bryobacteraceae bacterium]
MVRVACSFALLAAAVTAQTPDATVSIRVRFGVTDTQARRWDGSVAVAGGELRALRNWHPRPGDEISASAWKLATRRGVNFNLRPWEVQRLKAPVPYFLIPGVIVDVRASSGTRLSFRTAQGNFEVMPASIPPGAPAPALNGAVVVERVPAAETLSGAGYQSDFGAALGGKGEVWAAWVAYRDKGNEIFARRHDGAAWSAPHKVTEKPSDVFLAKLGRDGRGGVWAIWSDQVNGNFDLYGRRFDGRAWSGVERLTTDPQPDVYHNVATDSNGNLWVVWQGFRNGRSDVFARRYDGAGWSPEERLSASSANDWEPAIAADRQGRVYVAWDTYDKGNYDVVMRRWAGGSWSEEIPAANTPKYEAHVSLACDGQNRLWAAWNESGFEWGKDTGFLLRKQGTRLYAWRNMGVAVWNGSAWQEPADINASLPEELTGYNDFPILHADDLGRVWLAFRHRTLRIRDTESDAPAHRGAWELFATTCAGNGWTIPIPLPFSQSRMDARAGLASDGRGALWAVYPTDNRDFEEFLFERGEVHAGRLALPQGLAAPALAARHVPELAAVVMHPSEPQDLSRIRGYVVRSGGKEYRIWRGDVHRHTEFSMDGNNDGTLQQCYRYALDAASLDFMGVSDHNGMGGPDVEYINWLMQQMADVFMLPRVFSPLYAYERSVGYPNGHRNVLFASRGNPTLPIPPAEQKAKAGAAALFDYLKRMGGIAISHTSASSMGTDWRDNDAAVEPLVEIYQGDRVSAEYEGAPKAAYGPLPYSAPGGFRPAGYVWNAWAKGYKLGVQASSDHLSTHISYACTMAPELTRSALLDAMRRRHSYGATDNIILDYRLQSAGREYLQGDIVEDARDVRLEVKVIGTAPVRQIDVIRNNAFLHNRQPMQRDVAFSFVDAAPLTGESYYYVRVIQADDQMAWSSPVWVRRK